MNGIVNLNRRQFLEISGACAISSGILGCDVLSTEAAQTTKVSKPNIVIRKNDGQIRSVIWSSDEKNNIFNSTTDQSEQLKTLLVEYLSLFPLRPYGEMIRFSN